MLDVAAADIMMLEKSPTVSVKDWGTSKSAFQPKTDSSANDTDGYDWDSRIEPVTELNVFTSPPNPWCLGPIVLIDRLGLDQPCQGDVRHTIYSCYGIY